MLMLVHVLVAFAEIPLWECHGLVGSGLVVLGAVMLAVGKHKAEKLDVVPQQTLETMKEKHNGSQSRRHSQGIKSTRQDIATPGQPSESPTQNLAPLRPAGNGGAIL